MRHPHKLGTTRPRSAFTLIELLVVVAIIALLISILLPSLARARELSKRTVCRANLKNMGIGWISYANENEDDWPVPSPFAQPTNPGLSAVQYVGRIGFQRALSTTDPAFPNFPNANQISVTRCVWELVRNGSGSVKQIICPSASDDQQNNEDNPDLFYDVSTDATQPPDYNQISYAYQVPWGDYGVPNVMRHQEMVLAADKGPYGGTNTRDGGKQWPSGVSEAPDSFLTIDSSPDDWRHWNSPNHGGFADGEGQSALFADGHVEFFTKPTCSVDYDNIYTRWPTQIANREDRMHGTPPSASNEAPFANTDTLLYP